MTNPYHWVPDRYRGIVFVGLVLVTGGVSYALGQQGKPLTTETLPNGILEIELPWSEERAAEVVASWEQGGLVPVARKQVYADFLFLLLYPLALGFACAWLAGNLSGRLAQLGFLLAWWVLLAGLLDAIENIAILQMLGGSQGAPLPQIATIAAALKFTLVVVAFGYLVMGGCVRLSRWIRGV